MVIRDIVLGHREVEGSHAQVQTIYQEELMVEGAAANEMRMGRARCLGAPVVSDWCLCPSRGVSGGRDWPLAATDDLWAGLGLLSVAGTAEGAERFDIRLMLIND